MTRPDPTFRHKQPAVYNVLEVTPYHPRYVRLRVNDEVLDLEPATARRLAAGLERAADEVDGGAP